MKKVKISVVTIVKNDCKNIKNTMLSVIEQTYDNIEYIVKNAYSDDGTTDIIEEIVKQYRLKKIIHINNEDSGIYDAMNQAVAKANGDWILFMNSGDCFYNKHVLENIFLQEIPFDTGVIYGDAMVCRNGIKRIWKANMELIEKKMPFSHQSCLLETNFLKQHTFKTNLKIAADYSNILDYYFAGENFYNANMVISIFNLNGVSSELYVQRYKEREEVKKNHGIKINRIVYIRGLALEKVKTIIEIIVPRVIVNYLKRLYMDVKYNK